MRRQPIIKLLPHADFLLIGLSLFVFFTLTINKHKLEFYSLQNAVVENLVEQKSVSFEGSKVYEGMFFNTRTKTPELQFPGDAFEYNGRWYPAKSYGPHYAAALPYALLRLIGLSFSKQYHLVSSLLLSSTSLLLATLGSVATYLAAKRITGSRILALTVMLFLTFGSLLTGAINIRNEETFGYWLFIIVYTATFLPWKKRWLTPLFTVLLCYSAYSLPISMLLTPLGLYRIYLASGKKQLYTILTATGIFFAIVVVHNYLIFGRFVFSNYTIGMEKVVSFALDRFSFTFPNWREKLQFYFFDRGTSIFTNYPLVIFALVGIWVSSQKLLTKLLTFGSCLFFSFYITNIGELTGWVGFGSGRFMAGIFPVSYLYIAYLLRRFRLWLWLPLGIAAVVSVRNGLFYYFSGVKNVFDRGGAHFAPLPAQEHFFTIVSSLVVLFLFLLFYLDKLSRSKTRVNHA